MNVTVRHDDYDFRMNPQDYIDNHEKFIKAGIVETAVVQYTHDGNIPNYSDRLINYMKTAPNWDIQLHGWSHEEYDKLPPEEIMKHLDQSIAKADELFGIKPTVWYTPWNRRNEIMEDVARSRGLTINNESYDIAKFIREVRAGEYKGHSVYFHLWNKDEREKIDEMLECAKELL